MVTFRKNVQSSFKLTFSFTEKNVSMAVQFKYPGRKRIWWKIYKVGRNILNAMGFIKRHLDLLKYLCCFNFSHIFCKFYWISQTLFSAFNNTQMLLTCIVQSWNHLKLKRRARFIKYRDLSMSKNLDVIVFIFLINSFNSLISFISLITAKCGAIHTLYLNTTLILYSLLLKFSAVKIFYHCEFLYSSLSPPFIIGCWFFKIAAITWRKKRIQTASEFGVEFWNLYWCNCFLVCIFC